MGDISKVKLMDCGTARFQAKNAEDAARKVRSALALYGSVSQDGENSLLLDCSETLYHQFVSALIEPCSAEGEWAVSLREGNAPTFLGKILLRLGSHKECHRRVKTIIKELDTV